MAEGEAPRRVRAADFLTVCRMAGAALSVALASSAVLAQDALKVSELAPGVYVAVGVHEEASADNLGAVGNVGFVVGSKSVAVIDTGGSARAGERLRRAIRTVTELPIRFVVNTHVHPDHMMGNAAFIGDSPQFIGHRNLPRALGERGPHYLRRLHDDLGRAAEGTQLIGPSVTVDEVAELDLGERVLRLRAYPAAHTDTDLTVFDITSSVLWTGDLLFIERVPVIDGSLKGWLAASAELRKTDAALLVPGHGDPTVQWHAALDAQDRYLSTMLTEIRAVIARGGSIEQAVETVGAAERSRWVLYDFYNPRNVVTAYTELEWE